VWSYHRGDPYIDVLRAICRYGRYRHACGVWCPSVDTTPLQHVSDLQQLLLEQLGHCVWRPRGEHLCVCDYSRIGGVAGLVEATIPTAT